MTWRDDPQPDLSGRVAFAGLVAASLAVFWSGPARADTAVITSQNAGVVSFLDPDTGAIRATLAVPGDPVSVAIDAKRGQAYVLAVATRRLHVISLDGHAIRELPLPGAPFGIATGGSGTLWITDWEGRVHRIDPADGHVLQSLLTGANPSGVAFDEASGILAVTDRDDNRLSLFDAISGALLAHVPTGQHPFGVTLHEGRAYTADVLSDSVSVIDLASRGVVGTIAVGERPYAVAFAAGKGFVTNQYGGSVSVFDPATLQIVETIPVGEYPEGISATTAGDRVLVANWFSDTVSVIDTHQLLVTEEIDVAPGPRAFGTFIAP